jgi:hypothetical protein
VAAIRVLEYLDSSGRSPWRRWFNDLDAIAAAKVGTALYRLGQHEEAPERRDRVGAQGVGRLQAAQEGRCIGAGMALTREFKETVVARARRDAKFRDAMFAEAINAYLAGDTQTGKAMLRDLVNATIGFEALSAEVRKPSKSLHRMLAARGNPSTENFFGIVKALQKKTRTRLRVAVQAG